MGFVPLLSEMDYISHNTDKELSKMDLEEYDRIRQALIVAEFNAPDLGNMAIMKAIEGKDMAYAKHMIEGNDLLKVFASKKGGGVNMLKQPVCGRCEGVGTWGDFTSRVTNGEPVGYCDACGHVTKNPITVEQYLREYIKGIDSTTLEAIRPRLNEEIELIEREGQK